MVRGWVVEGQVQGVGFRWFVKQKARELGLAGTVRNLADASVEVMASGPDERLTALEAALRKGPPGADVQQLRKVTAPVELEGSKSFDITR